MLSLFKWWRDPGSMGGGVLAFSVWTLTSSVFTIPCLPWCLVSPTPEPFWFNYATELNHLLWACCLTVWAEGEGPRGLNGSFQILRWSLPCPLQYPVPPWSELCPGSAEHPHSVLVCLLQGLSVLILCSISSVFLLHLFSAFPNWLATLNCCFLFSSVLLCLFCFLYICHFTGALRAISYGYSCQKLYYFFCLVIDFFCKVK